MLKLQVSVVICMCFSSLTYAIRDFAEPKCSRFHYEEQLLEKTIRLEIKFEQLLDEIKQSEDRLKEERRLMSEERLNDKRELQTFIDNSKNDIKSHLDKLEDARKEDKNRFDHMIKEMEKHQVIAFEADTTTDTSPNDGATIVFSNTKLNEGNGYDNQTGVFTAPVDGVYILTVQFCLQYQTMFRFDIIVDNVAKNAQLDNYNSSGYSSCFTSHTTAKMTAKSTAYVKSTGIHGSQTLSTDNYSSNSFTGILINRI